MTFTKTAAIALAAALPLFAAAQTSFNSFQEARTAVDKALREKNNDEALRLVTVAAPMARNQGEKEWVYDCTTRAYEAMGESNRADLVRFAMPVIEQCTNFTRCSGTVRAVFGRAVNASFASGDLATFKKLVDILARDKEVTMPVFDLWQNVAYRLADDAVELKKKAPEQQKAIVAGFRTEGSTFGLYDFPLEVEGKPALDRARVAEAEAILTRKMPQENLSIPVIVRRNSGLFEIQRKIENDKGQEVAIARIKDFVLTAKPVAREDAQALYVNAAGSTFNYYRDLGTLSGWTKYAEIAREYEQKLKDYYGDFSPFLKGRELAGYFRAGNERAYETLLAEFDKRPVDTNLLDACRTANEAMAFRYALPPQVTERLFARVAANRDKFQPVERGQILEVLFNSAKAKGDRKVIVQYWAEIERNQKDSRDAWEAENAREKEARAAKQPFERNSNIPKPDNTADKLRSAYYAYLSGMKDFATLLPIREQAVKDGPGNPGSSYELAAAYYYLGRNKEAANALAAAVTNESQRADLRFNSMVLKAACEAQNKKDFKSRVLALRGFSDAQGKEGESKVDSDTRFFNFLRAASRNLYMIKSDPAHVDFMLGLVEITHDMEHPEEKVRYTAKFIDGAPRTAEGALYAGIFEKYPVENRIGRYRVYDYMDKNNDLAILKSKDAPHLQADVPGKEAAIVILYDTTGVHFYLKLNDPDASKSRDGLADGANIEFSVMPGEMTTWNWNLVSVRYPQKSCEVEWDSPMPGRKLTGDYVAVDASSTDKCHVFHIFTPWVMYYDRLPGNGDTWRFVLCAGWAGQFGALGGGSVHEFGRGMQLRFDIPSDVADRIREGVVKEAVSEYQKVRGEWENADFWADPHMGDQDFAGAVVRPFLSELDGIAKIVTGGQLNKAEVDRICKDYLFSLADFRLALDAKRVEWVEKKLYGE